MPVSRVFARRTICGDQSLRSNGKQREEGRYAGSVEAESMPTECRKCQEVNKSHTLFGKYRLALNRHRVILGILA